MGIFKEKTKYFFVVLFISFLLLVNNPAQGHEKLDSKTPQDKFPCFLGCPPYGPYPPYYPPPPPPDLTNHLYNYQDGQSRIFLNTFLLATDELFNLHIVDRVDDEDFPPSYRFYPKGLEEEDFPDFIQLLDDDRSTTQPFSSNVSYQIPLLFSEAGDYVLEIEDVDSRSSESFTSNKSYDVKVISDLQQGITVVEEPQFGTEGLDQRNFYASGYAITNNKDSDFEMHYLHDYHARTDINIPYDSKYYYPNGQAIAWELEDYAGIGENKISIIAELDDSVTDMVQYTLNYEPISSSSDFEVEILNAQNEQYNISAEDSIPLIVELFQNISFEEQPYIGRNDYQVETLNLDEMGNVINSVTFNLNGGSNYNGGIINYTGRLGTVDLPVPLFEGENIVYLTKTINGEIYHNQIKLYGVLEDRPTLRITNTDYFAENTPRLEVEYFSDIYDTAESLEYRYELSSKPFKSDWVSLLNTTDQKMPAPTNNQFEFTIEAWFGNNKIDMRAKVNGEYIYESYEIELAEAFTDLGSYFETGLDRTMISPAELVDGQFLRVRGFASPQYQATYQHGPITLQSILLDNQKDFVELVETKTFEYDDQSKMPAPEPTLPENPVPWEQLIRVKPGYNKLHTTFEHRYNIPVPFDSALVYVAATETEYNNTSRTSIFPNESSLWIFN